MIRFFLKYANRRGFEIVKAGVTDRISISYLKIFSHFKIDTILDVGANEGQYAMAMRKLGYSNKIVSFEPISAVYKKLSANTSEISNWAAINIALGDKDGEEYINVSQNTVSSSLLEMLPEHVKQEAGSVYTTKEKITIRKLDSVFNIYTRPESSVYLKLDVQGFEKNVIDGASDSLRNIKLIQLEMAIVPLYKGELLLADMINYMNGKGFVLYNLIPGFHNFETGQQFQTDGIFVRKDLLG